MMRYEKLWLPVLLLLGLFAAVDYARPLLPIDETRYLTVAWEYLSRGEWVLPTLNFEPYHHKPPMLFWLLNMMWQITGTQSIWAARIVPMIASIATLGLTSLLAKTLWPDRPMIATAAPLMILAAPFLLIYSSLIMFDTLLCVAALLALYGLLRVHLTGNRLNWLIVGLAIGLGGLIKGPVILLHVLPVVLLYPLWRKPTNDQAAAMPRLSRFYLGLVLAIVMGVALTLAWAIPAAKIGGPEYERMIFWGQSAGRMVNSFDHGRPFWFYLVVLPLMLLPWFTLPSLWSALRGALQDRKNWAWQTRFILCWIVPVFAAFMAISGKQVHYLIPILPGFYLLMASGLFGPAKTTRLSSTLKLYLTGVAPIFLVTALLASLDLIVPAFGLADKSPVFIQIAESHPFPLLMALGFFLITGGILILTEKDNDILQGLQSLAVAGVVFVGALHISVQPLFQKYYDLSTIGSIVSDASALGAPVAVARAWQGELGYYARLNKSITVLQDDEILPWLNKNKTGIVIYRHNTDAPPKNVLILYTQPYRSPTKAISIVARKNPGRKKT